MRILSAQKSGFTIVELIVVIAVIAILAVATIFSLGAWQSNVRKVQVKNALNAAAQAMEGVRTFASSYPASLPSTYTPSEDVTVTLPYRTASEFCLEGVSTNDASVKFYLYSKQVSAGPVAGVCADRPSLDPPAAPAGPSVASSTQTTLTFGWSTVAAATSYVAQCAIDPAIIQSKKEFTVNAPTVSQVFTSLDSYTQYYCRVKAVNSVGSSAWSDIASGKTGSPPNAPVVTATTNSSAEAIFTWPAVSGASSYTLQYNIDGGPWVNGITQENLLTFKVSGYHKRTIGVRVVSNSSEGVVSSYGTASVVTPLWGTFTYQNNWSDYGGSYSTGGFTRTSTGAVVLKGLLKRSGAVVSGETIAQLPHPTYYPDTYTGAEIRTYTFMGAISGSGPSSSIKLTSDGKIIASTDVSATATSLSQIAYLPSTATSGDDFTALTPISGWANRASTEPSLGYRIDSLGRVFLQGSLDPGTITSGTDFALLPTSSPNISVSPKLIVPLRAGCNGYTGINVETALTTRGNCLGTALFTQTMYYPDAAGASWTTMTLKNSWVVFNATSNATPQYTKSADGIVTLKGLIKSGSVTSGVVLTTLPPGYRPSATLVFANICADAPCRIDVESSGDVTGRGVDAGWTSLSGINFVAEE